MLAISRWVGIHQRVGGARQRFDIAARAILQHELESARVLRPRIGGSPNAKVKASGICEKAP